LFCKKPSVRRKKPDHPKKLRIPENFHAFSAERKAALHRKRTTCGAAGLFKAYFL
jgi:hypothetical protein